MTESLCEASVALLDGTRTGLYLRGFPEGYSWEDEAGLSIWVTGKTRAEAIEKLRVACGGSHWALRFGDASL